MAGTKPQSPAGPGIAYTHRIEKLRHALAIGTLIMAVVMGYSIWRYNARRPDRVQPTPVTTVSDADVVVHGVELVEYVHERTLWNLWADEASVYSATKTTHLRTIAADFYDEDGVKSLHLTSDSGVKNDLTGTITASGNVEADALEAGAHLTTDELVYDAATQTISSDTHVELTRANMITAGHGLKTDVHLNRVRILRQVETRLAMPDPTEPPALITADALQLDHGAQRATYTGGVTAVQRDTEMRADRMRVFLGTDDTAEASSADAIERIEVFGDVVVDRGTVTAMGDNGEYSAASQMLVLHGSPTVQARAEDRAAGQRMQADVIRLNLETNDIAGDGDVTISTLSSDLPGMAAEPRNAPPVSGADGP